MTRLTRVLVFSAFSASSALGQSGVLIGVSSPSTGYETTRYETLWIIRDTSRPLQATLPDLLVPRAEGWWRVGTASICPTGGPDGQGMDVLWRTRADSTPVISEICHEAPRGELPLPIYAEDSATVDSLKREIVRCSWSNIDIKFVSSEYIAVGERSGQTEECEPRGGRWYQTYYVSRFNGDSSLALSRFAAANVDSLGRLALAREAKELAKDEVCTNIAEGFNAAELFDIGNAWYPTRVAGRWSPVVMEQLGTGECQLLPTVDIALTRALTGHDSLRVPWSALAKRVKGLGDAFTSPSGDLIVVHAGDSLYVHVGDRQQLGRRIAGIPFAKREIVMIQWATGRNVARWDQEIASMVRRGLPGPRVVPAPKDP